MDSFYDQPRRAPIPTGITSTANRLPVIPSTVPDASLLLQNRGNVPQKKSEMSYNAWKYQLRAESSKSCPNKENIVNPVQSVQSKDSIFRKQVRFETPRANFPEPVAHMPPTNFNVLPMRPTLVKKPTHALPLQPPRITPEPDHFAMPRETVKNRILQAKPFEKMYMANVPSRNLDLSIIEPSKTLNRCNSAPERIEFYRNDYTQTDAAGIRRPMAESTTLELKKPEEVKTVATNNKSDDEPSVKDLFKIIQQQNEQLLCLQQQVASLLKEKSQQPQIEAPSNDCQWNQPVLKNKILENVLHGQGGSGAHNQRPNKFAIDVMTSFEVSIRAPNRFAGGNALEKAKITEILDESKNCKTDLSLKLDEPVVVVDERCLSPENSIHVDMKDYSSDEEIDQEIGDLDRSTLGYTIYNNVMDQVNFLLKNYTDNQSSSTSSKQDQQCTKAIMKQVKEATLKHLQTVGVNMKNVEDDITISTEGDYTPTQVSFAVKQLLMKYLPDEQLARVAGRAKQANFPQNNAQGADYPKNLIKRRPDFSMATVQYMEKYNLLNRDANSRQNEAKFKKSATPPVANDKMLDITALKQQPKLI